MFTISTTMYNFLARKLYDRFEYSYSNNNGRVIEYDIFFFHSILSWNSPYNTFQWKHRLKMHHPVLVLYKLQKNLTIPDTQVWEQRTNKHLMQIYKKPSIVQYLLGVQDWSG